jgi:hypothetical protein
MPPLPRGCRDAWLRVQRSCAGCGCAEMLCRSMFALRAATLAHTRSRTRALAVVHDVPIARSASGGPGPCSLSAPPEAARPRSGRCPAPPPSALAPTPQPTCQQASQPLSILAWQAAGSMHRQAGHRKHCRRHAMSCRNHRHGHTTPPAAPRLRSLSVPCDQTRYPNPQPNAPVHRRDHAQSDDHGPCCLAPTPTAPPRPTTDTGSKSCRGHWHPQQAPL